MKKFSIEIKWGLIFTGMTFAWMFLEELMGWHGEKINLHATLTNLFAIPAILIYILALRDKRQSYYSGKMNWLQGFFCGLLISLVIAALNPLVQFINTKYISPEFFPNAIDYAVEIEMRTRHQAERYFTLGNYILRSMFGAITMGTITSAIVAVFVRKKRS